MSYYTTTSLDERNMGSTCVGYGTGLSHERIIQGAGGEIGRDGFKDPRPGHSGEMIADRVYIDERDNTIRGIDFRKDDGSYCCSYTGKNYNDIKKCNRMDCENKREQEEVSNEEERINQIDKEAKELRSDAIKQYVLSDAAKENGDFMSAREYKREGDRLLGESQKKEEEYKEKLNELHFNKNRNLR